MIAFALQRRSLTAHMRILTEWAQVNLAVFLAVNSEEKSDKMDSLLQKPQLHTRTKEMRCIVP